MLELRALHAEVDGLRPGGFELCLRLADIGIRGDAAVVAMLREAQRFLVRLDRVCRRKRRRQEDYSPLPSAFRKQ